MLVRFVGLLFFFFAVLVTSGYARPGPNEGQDAVPVPAEPATETANPSPSAAKNVEGEALPAAAENTPEETPFPEQATEEQLPPEEPAGEQPAVKQPAQTTPAAAEPAVTMESSAPADQNVEDTKFVKPHVNEGQVDQDKTQAEEPSASEGQAARTEENFVYKYADPIEAAYKLFGDSNDANERAQAAWELARRSLAALKAIEEQLISGHETQAHIEADITTTNGKSTLDVAATKEEGEAADTNNENEEVPAEKRTRRKSARRSARVSIE